MILKSVVIFIDKKKLYLGLHNIYNSNTKIFPLLQNRQQLLNLAVMMASKLMHEMVLLQSYALWVSGTQVAASRTSKQLQSGLMKQSQNILPLKQGLL